MGWKDLFKSKPPDLKPDPRLRWFGKLPTYADYYSSAADADWVVEFNDWLLNGCELHFARQPAARREMHLQTVSGILRLPKSGMTVFASIQDYGGDTRGRPFPIAFYVGIPTAAWPGPTGDRVLSGLRVLSELLLMRDLVVRFVNAPARFEGVFGGRTIDLAGLTAEAGDASLRTAAQATPMESWFAQAVPCLKDGDSASWCAAVANWGGSIAKLEGDDFGPTLRLPLVMSLAVELQVAGWLRWLARRINVEQRFLSLLVQKDAVHGTGRLTIIARDLIPEDYLLFTPLASTLNFVDDACALGGSRDVNGRSADLPGPPAAAAPKTWAEFAESA